MSRYMIESVPEKCKACRRCEIACIAAHHGLTFKEALKKRDELVARVHVVKSGTYVKASTSANDGQTPAQTYVLDGGTCVMLKQGGGIGFSGIENVDAVIGDRTLGCWHLGCSDIHAAIDLHGVCRDDLSAKDCGDALGKFGFSRGSRSLETYDLIAVIRHQTTVPCR